MEMHTLGAFFVASTLLALAPGPDNIYVIAQSALHGWRRGVIITLGLCSGLVGHGALVALGVASILMTSPVAMSILQGLGAAWLCWIGFQALRAALARPTGDDQPSTADSGMADGGDGSGAEQRVSGWQLYRRGVIMNLSNPKVFIFFMAFLPQFVDPDAVGLFDNMTIQVALLSVLFMLAALLVFSSMALVSARVGSTAMQSPMAQRWLNGLSGLVFMGLAAKLATTRLVQ